jgi:RHH-type proline utilization regulon transcriptional repressor/proline dehydrogenase/delta 1-pyrroline-5-carboxylate dehydrogenase
MIEGICSGDPKIRVSRVVTSTAEEVERSVQRATEAWPTWRDAAVRQRSEYLERLAQRLEEDRPALTALECFEVSKPIREADADVSEAIDFCRYYARMAVAELAPQRLPALPDGPFTEIPGEDNVISWEGRGPTAVIAPWNFPLAILCGMACAALAAGNTVILKPAEQSSAVAWRLFQHMAAAGFPRGVVQLLPGRGEDVGAALVGHPHVAQIAFTGSRAVGLAIWERAGRTISGQPWLKKVVCEMGGKNAVIVDEDADIDEAVAGIMHSAFGYAGQKCSACSRVVTVGAVFDTFIRRLIEATRSIIIAPAHQSRCELPPVIDEQAWRRLREVIAHPGDGAEPLYVGGTPTGGFFVAPAIFLISDKGHRLMQEELFGPVLAIHRTASFEDAQEVVGSTEYALTAGLYSRSPSHIAEARKLLRVGNLYINRGITGAAVGRQPFGGFKMSGGGTKAGGPGYLLQFSQPRSICENTERRGFVPGLDV